MAGPSLSHILDPRPASGLGGYSSPSPSFASRPGENHYQTQHRYRSPPSTLAAPPVHTLLKPPSPAPTPTSTLQVRPGPSPGAAPAGVSSPAVPVSILTSGPIPTLAPISASAPPTTVYLNNHRASHAQTPSQGHNRGHSQSESRPSPVDPGSVAGNTTAATSPASPGGTPVTASGTAMTTPLSQSNHRGNNLYACRDCGRSYSRPEHLVRHVQTHTLGRRFVCDICQKSFARKDLLRRHVANHDNDSPKKRRRTTTSPGAGRVSHACRSCAVARVKCDDTKPCKRCVSRKLNCVSTETPSTAAMHLMHFSANAHANISASNKANSDGDKSTTAHSVASRDSHSPGSFPHSHQPRSVQPAPQSVAPENQAVAVSFDRNKPRAQTQEKQSFHESRPNFESTPPPIEFQPSTSVMDPDRLSFSDFLRDVLYENVTELNKTNQIQGLLVLDFCDNESVELTLDDFGLIDKWNAEDTTQTRRELVNIWTNSPHHSREPYAPDGVLSVKRSPGLSPGELEKRDHLGLIARERLDQSNRDRALVIVLGKSRQPAIANRLASSFPSLELMDILVNSFVTNLAYQASEWLHLPTFRLNSQIAEWISMAAASGAVSSPIPGLRRFGFTLQDAVLASIPTRLEEGSPVEQDLGLIQCLITAQDIGLWSGNRRKMEISEGSLSIPVTMMRYRKKLHKSSYPALVVDPSDDGSVLEEKWMRWVSMEKWKRLVFHCFLQNAQCSMTTLTNATMSYAELALPLPEPSEIWLAKSAVEWKTLYLQRNSGGVAKAPSIGDLFQDAHLLPSNRSQVDVQFSISIYLHAFWALILEYQQLSAVHRSRSYTSSNMAGNQNLLLTSRHGELVKELQNFRLVSSEWSDMTWREHILLNLLMMNLHVSLDDVQLFAGREGDEQARRIYPVLQQWASGAEGRSAVGCAGQILRHAKESLPGQLRDFYAVAVQHAALVLWTYGVVSKASRRQAAPLPSQHALEPIYLDGLDPMPIQRFISFGQGRAMIRGTERREPGDESAVEDPRECMDIAQEVLRSNFRTKLDVGSEGLPPMVDNLCCLINQLGEAAWNIGLG